MNLKKITATVVKIVFWMLLAIATVQVFLRVTGHIPTIEELILALVFALFGFFLLSAWKISSFMGEMREFKTNSQESFRRIRVDMDSVKPELEAVRNETQNLKRNQAAIRKDFNCFKKASGTEYSLFEMRSVVDK